MAYAAPEGDGRICRVHGLALRTEIGERLRASLALEPAEMPAYLLMLTKRLRDERSESGGI